MRRIWINDLNSKSQGMRNLLDYFLLELDKREVTYFLFSETPFFRRIVLPSEEVLFSFGNYSTLVIGPKRRYVNFSNLNLTHPEVSLLWRLKQFYFRLSLTEKDIIIVPTHYVKSALLKRYSKLSSTVIRVIPYYEKEVLLNIPKSVNRENIEDMTLYCFGSNAPHKRVGELLLGLNEAYFRGLRLKTIVTVPRKTNEWNFVLRMKQHGFPIRNLLDGDKLLNRESLFSHFSQIDICLYPSKIETFGYGLVEAAIAGHFVLVAHDTTYWTDVIDPSGRINMETTSTIADSLLKLSLDNLTKPTLKFQNEIDNLIDEILRF